MFPEEPSSQTKTPPIQLHSLQRERREEREERDLISAMSQDRTSLTDLRVRSFMCLLTFVNLQFEDGL